VYEAVMLSAGFECDAFLWDLNTKDNVALLKGHRYPIVAAKLMCEMAQAEKDYRALTVDESGEFRLWNIFLHERGNDAKLVPTIQVFMMQHSEPPLNQFRFLALPYNPRYSTSYYSNVIACSSKLMHFVPEKNTKEFIPPAVSVFNEAASNIITTVGKSVLTFDISLGAFSDVFENVTSHDLTALCMDGERGRRMYVGNTAGELVLLNSMNGAIIDSVQYHSKDITSIQQVVDSRSSIYTSGMDGHLRLFEECNGKILIHNSVDFAFAEGVGITLMKICTSMHLLIAASAKNSWGLWNDLSLKKLLIINEMEAVTAMEIIPTYTATKNGKDAPTESPSSTMLTLAVAMFSGISIYTFDFMDLRGIRAFHLVHSKQLYISQIALLRSPEAESLNYSAKRSVPPYAQGFYLLAATDDGHVLLWDATTVKSESERIFKKVFENGINSNLLGPSGGALSSKIPRMNSLSRFMSNHTNTNTPQGHHSNPSHSRNPSKSSHDHHTRNLLNGSAAGKSYSSHGAMDSSEGGSLDEENFHEAVQLWGGVSSGKHAAPKGHPHPAAAVPKHATHIAPHGAHGSSTPQRHPPDKHPPGSVFLTGVDNAAQSNPHATSPPKNTHGHAPLTHQLSNIHLSHDLGKHLHGAHSHNNIPHYDTHDGHHGGLPNSSSSSVAEGTSSWVEVDSHRMFEQPPAGEGGTRQTLRHFQAHSDSICVMVPMQAHSCFFTGSLDGYQRVWNLDLDFLGELVLPNITESMKKKAMSSDPGSSWSFILERISVSKNHEDIAKALLRTLAQSHKERMQEQQLLNMERRNATTFSLRGFNTESLDEDGSNLNITTGGIDESHLLRKEMLRSLVESQPPPSDKPPSRMPTKEEKELLKLSLTLEAYNLAGRRSEFDGKGELFSPQQTSSPQLGGGFGSASVQEQFPSISNSPFNASGVPSPNSRANLLTASNTLGSHKKAVSEMKKALIGKSVSFFTGTDASEVCLSVMGIPSLWSVPGEKDIFGDRIGGGVHSSAPENVVPPAFSDLSLKSMLREGLIDVEAQRILRRVGKNADNVSVYERSQPTLLIRSPSMSTSVTLPSLDNIRRTEIPFGVQKDMYKNAERVLNGKENVTKSQIRNSIAQARIELNVRKINSMVHLIQPPSHDEVILPKSGVDGNAQVSSDYDEMHKIRTDDQKMKLRLLKSASLVPPDALERARPLDYNSISKWVAKVKDAADFGDKRDGKKKKKKREVLSQLAVHNIETRLRNAIRAEYRARMLKAQPKNRPLSSLSERGDSGSSSSSLADTVQETSYDAGQKVTISTRALLPYYNLDNVNQFLDIFAKVDENFSGDLDVHEWIKLFTSLNESIPVQEARMIFMKLDEDHDGFLTMKELIPVIFSKANRDQMQIIIRYCDAQLTKSLDNDSILKVNPVDIDQLFEAYDAESIGFVDVSLIKERIKAMNLSEKIMFYLMETMAELADDEMVSLVEFRRLFKNYISKK